MKDKLVVKGMGLICAMSLMSGCWDHQEINNLNLLVASAVDLGKQKKIALTFQWFNPEASSGGNRSAQSQTTVLSYTLEGDSIKEAEKDFTKISSRIPVYSHLHSFIIGRELAEKGIQELLDHFGREIQLRRTNVMLVAGGKGEDIIQVATQVETSGIDIREILESTNQSSEYELVNYNDFMVHYTDPDLLSCLPMIHIVPSKGGKSPSGSRKKRL